MVVLLLIFFCSYEDCIDDKQDIAKKLVTGENSPMNRVYKPEFVTLAPPLMNCQDEVILLHRNFITLCNKRVQDTKTLFFSIETTNSETFASVFVSLRI